MSYELPTIDECQEFLRTINRGREAIGMDALETLDFDGCEPGNPRACLSATNLFVHVSFSVGCIHVHAEDPGYERAQDKLIAALAMPPAGCGDRLFKIPREIVRVTEIFDESSNYDGYYGERQELYDALRARMVEAGVV